MMDILLMCSRTARILTFLLFIRGVKIMSLLSKHLEYKNARKHKLSLFLNLTILQMSCECFTCLCLYNSIFLLFTSFQCLTYPELTPNMDRAPWSAVHPQLETRSSSGCLSHLPAGAPSPSASRYGRPGWTPPGAGLLDQDLPASGRPLPDTNLVKQEQMGD